MKTYAPKPRDIERRWYVIDADGAVLGRLASEVAKILRGKHKPIFAPHADTGDHVIVVNARGVRLTGGKELKKVAYRHSGYPGGLREIPYDRLLATRPAWAVEKAVRGMLPKNRLGRAMFKKLSVYDGPEHPHAAQKPLALKLGETPSWDGLPRPPAPEEPKAKGPARDAASTPKRAPKGEAKTAGAEAAEARSPKRSTGKRSTATTAKSSTAKRAATKGRGEKRADEGTRTERKPRSSRRKKGEGEES